MALCNRFLLQKDCRRRSQQFCAQTEDPVCIMRDSQPAQRLKAAPNRETLALQEKHYVLRLCITETGDELEPASDLGFGKDQTADSNNRSLTTWHTRCPRRKRTQRGPCPPSR